MFRSLGWRSFADQALIVQTRARGLQGAGAWSRRVRSWGAALREEHRIKQLSRAAKEALVAGLSPRAARKAAGTRARGARRSRGARARAAASGASSRRRPAARGRRPARRP